MCPHKSLSCSFFSTPMLGTYVQQVPDIRRVAGPCWNVRAKTVLQLFNLGVAQAPDGILGCKLHWSSQLAMPQPTDTRFRKQPALLKNQLLHTWKGFRGADHDRLGPNVWNHSTCNRGTMLQTMR